MLVLLSVTISQSSGNVMTMTEPVPPTEHVSDMFEGTSEELFDPSKQPQQSDINFFHVAERELGIEPEEPDQTTTTDDIYDHIQFTSNTSIETDAEPLEHFNQSTYHDQTEYDATLPIAADTAFSSLAPNVHGQSSSSSSSSVPSDITTPSLMTTTSAIPTTPTGAVVRRIKKIQTTQAPPPPPLKQNANEILQRLLDDQYIRTPMAALIDTSAEALRKSKMLWKAALRPQAPLDIVLVAYNSTGMYTSVGVVY